MNWVIAFRIAIDLIWHANCIINSGSVREVKEHASGDERDGENKMAGRGRR